MMDALNFMLGNYIKIATHAPKKYPKKPVGLQNDKDGQMTSDDEAKINALMGVFAQKTNQLPSVGEKTLKTGENQATQP